METVVLTNCSLFHHSVLVSLSFSTYYYLLTFLLSPMMETSRAGGKRGMENKMKGLVVGEEEDDDEEDDDTLGLGSGEDDKKKKKVSGRKGSSGGGLMQPSCQVDNCSKDMTYAKPYHRRHKVCEFHAKAPVVVLAGLEQRFCQQCSRLGNPSISIFCDSWFCE